MAKNTPEKKSFEMPPLHFLDVGHINHDTKDKLFAPSCEKTLTLNGGRVIWLTHMHQFETYEGLVIGLPDDPEEIIRRNAIKALKTFDWPSECPPVILPVTVRTGEMKYRKPGNDSPHAKILANVPDSVGFKVLPKICSFLVFASTKTSEEIASHGSRALIICFQNEFGFPKKPETLDAIRDAEWERYAINQLL